MKKVAQLIKILLFGRFEPLNIKSGTSKVRKKLVF